MNFHDKTMVDEKLYRCRNFSTASLTLSHLLFYNHFQASSAYQDSEWTNKLSDFVNQVVNNHPLVRVLG